MNLQCLIPSTKKICALILTRHALGTLSSDAAVAVAFDPSDCAYVLFVERDTEELLCPASIAYCVVIFNAESLHTFVKVIKRLNLNRAQEVTRMTSSMLSLLATYLYEIQFEDERLLALAGILNRFAVQGIVTGIAKEVVKQLPFATCPHPEQN